MTDSNDKTAQTIKDDFWHLDGKHRGSARTANGKDVTRFESGIREHRATCQKISKKDDK